jgi:hypothetical protein
MQDPDDLRASWKAAEEKPAEDLPPLTTLSIDVKGSRGKQYKANFVFKVPTIGEQIEIGRLKAAYLPNGSAADPNAALLVEQCCFLAVTIQKTNLPVWWKPFEMYDAAPVSALYAEALKYERRFHLGDAQPGAAAAGVGTPEERSGDDSETESALGEDIPPPAQRRKVLLGESARGG